MSTTPDTWGARPEEWQHFGPDWLDLTPDLLPVVSNPHAEISTDSHIKSPGKVPSEYNGEGKLRGLAGWTARKSTARQVERWSQQPDYGICIQTRDVRAVDVDVPDVKLAGEVFDLLHARLGTMPLRQRSNSAKFLIAFKLPGELAKRKITLRDGSIIEFLANGQQFVAAGTHPSGERYTWRGGLPYEFPELGMDEFEATWSALAAQFGSGEEGGGSYTTRKREADVDLPDALADHLRGAGRVLRTHRGALVVECPWHQQHTSGEAGDGSTVYYPAGTRGYEHGAFKCMHGHCTGRTTRAFGAAVGYVDPTTTPEAEFGDFDDGEPVPPPVAPTEGAQAPTASTQPAQDDEPDIFDPSAFTTIAAAFWRKKLSGPSSTWRKWNGLHYGWTGTHWTELSADQVGVKLHVFLTHAQRLGVYDPKTKTRGEPLPFNPAKKHTDEVTHALRSLILLDAERAPAWARGCPRDECSRLMRAEDMVSLGNGLFHLPTRELVPHTPAYFTLNALPFEHDETATCPTWLQFLTSLWPEDRESIDTLQEVMGYLLTADTSQHKVFVLQGPPRGGKGLIARIITALVGLPNVAGPSLSSLARQFGLQPLIGKLVAIIGDARSAGKDSQAAIETLLGISGEDTFTIDRKNRESWEGKLSARVLMLSNETLSLPDASGAMASRMLVLKLTQSWLGREDKSLEPRIRAELPGIFRWALDGRNRLAERGHFVQPTSAAGTLEQMSELNSPVKTFVEDCCELDFMATVPKRQLYAAYRTWCIGAGLQPPSEEIFSKNLMAAFTRITTTRPRVGDGPRLRHFTGVRIAPHAQDEFDKADL